jgi:NADH-quinone oxidoreductase subunit C
VSATLPPYESSIPGSARDAAGLPAPVTPHDIAQHGGAENPSVAALRERFPAAVVRSFVMWGDSTVVVTRESVHDIVRFLRNDPAQAYNYLVDVTAVEFRDAEQALEVVWHLRSLPWQRFLRLKVELPVGAALEVASVTDLYAGADWLERECYDMFGITFTGHPDLRRILMWDTYKEGHPLRKDFPLRGRFSRAEQLSQALSIDTAGRYSMTELTIAEAFDDLPADMKARLADRRAAAGDAALPATPLPNDAEPGA